MWQGGTEDGGSLSSAIESQSESNKIPTLKEESGALFPAGWELGKVYNASGGYNTAGVFASFPCNWPPGCEQTHQEVGEE